jgi:ADP-heptose:LPS heptosyltransferase
VLKILIVRVSSLGDVVHNMPMLADIMQHYPAAEIDWVVEEAYTDLVRLNSHVRHIIPVALRRWRRSLLTAATRAEMQAFYRRLRQESYDFIFDTQGLLKTGAVMRMARLSEGGQRVGLANGTEGSGYEPLSRLFHMQSVRVGRHTHAVLRARLVAASALGYEIDSPADFSLQAVANCGVAGFGGQAVANGRVAAFGGQPAVIGSDTKLDLSAAPIDHASFSQKAAIDSAADISLQAIATDSVNGSHEPSKRTDAAPAWLPAEPYAVFFHSTARAAKQWPAAHWVRIAQLLAVRGLPVLLPWGSESERAAAEQLAAQMPNARVLPRLSMIEAVLLVQRTALAIGVDTGLTHIAAACLRPTIELYCDSPRWKTEGNWSPKIINLGDRGTPPAVEKVAAALERLLAPSKIGLGR